MATKRWDKTRVLMFGAILLVEVAVCSYLFLFINRLKSDEAQRLTTARAELQTLQNDAGQLTDLRKQFSESKRVLAHLEPGVAPDRRATYLPTLLAQIQTLAKRADVDLEVMNPRSTGAPTNPVPAAAPSQTPNGTSDGTAAAAAAPAPPPTEKVSASLTLSGTFPNLMTFLEGLKGFPKVIEIDSMQFKPEGSDYVPPGASPRPDISMDISGVVLPLMPEVKS